VSLAFFTSHGLVFQGLLPTYLDKVFTALLWLWFINLYNFMDGIDGITGIETLCIGVGLAALSLFIPDYAVEFGYIGLMLAASVLGFLVWNWHPAKIFLGDSGSVSLGYLLGWLLIELAMAGYWQAALIIPGYYLFDSSFTLARRILRREKFWQAHSQHFYQKAVRRGISPRTVVSLLFITNVILIALAWATAHNLLLWWAPAFALAFIISLIVVLLRLKPRTL
jgi:UDP-N-acetylmuramyl pentapeptide phosphotransferase/UDP-N-acetylglucosamine-1-phosphate transferase